MTLKKLDMKQCHSFLQDTELHGPMHRILENEISRLDTIHMLQNSLR